MTLPIIAAWREKLLAQEYKSLAESFDFRETSGRLYITCCGIAINEITDCTVAEALAIIADYRSVAIGHRRKEAGRED